MDGSRSAQLGCALGAGSRLVVASALVILGDGCTFLISFDDKPSPGGGGAEASVPPPSGPEAGASEEAGAIPTMPPCDPSFPLSEIVGCSEFVEGGQICADNPGLTAYPGDRTKDVVTCSKTQGATCVRHCVACAHLPPGFPDQCDQCIGKADGQYCGTDMGFQPDNFRLLVTCKGERMETATPCSTAGCDSKGGTGSATCR